MSDVDLGADLPEIAHFVGRVEERAELVDALTSGVNSIASVMGGRGMGKSSLLRQVERDLAAHPIKVVRVDFPGTAASFLARVGATVTSESLEQKSRAAVDRMGRPLAPAYRAACIAGAAEVFPAGGATPADGTAPAFVTEHPRAGGTSLRVYHFLLQLPPDA